ncbi:NACHT domain-containing protein [Chloroflexi bacterium TSY]|nr:NACHT domain-containing protein [Chloroflexi bacterium TSY]
MADYLVFSELLNRYLGEQERSQAWLARRIGVTGATVTRWVNNETRPGEPDIVVFIADTFDLNEQECVELEDLQASFEAKKNKSALVALVAIRGRSKISIDVEEAYNTHSLPNPYLGLRTFTYDERSFYAGRESLIEKAVDLLTLPGEQRTLFFITGASGSGKSSFVQAGLLPALKDYYEQQDQTVCWEIFRPSHQPLAGLSDALLQLGLPAERVSTDTGKCMLRLSSELVSDNQIRLLVIDQFEELFTQSDLDERDSLFELLEALPSFSNLRMHIIATLRIDYFPELFAYKTLYDIAKQGIDLHVMSADELTLAIQRPLQHVYPDGEKRFETALVESSTQCVW